MLLRHADWRSLGGKCMPVCLTAIRERDTCVCNCGVPLVSGKIGGDSSGWATCTIKKRPQNGIGCILVVESKRGIAGVSDLPF